MNEPREYFTKWSKSDRERQMAYDITHRWNLIFKTDTSEYICKTNRFIGIESKLMVTKEERQGCIN